MIVQQQNFDQPIELQRSGIDTIKYFPFSGKKIQQSAIVELPEACPIPNDVLLSRLGGNKMFVSQYLVKLPEKKMLENFMKKELGE
ncbi:MAG: hypothetical protein LBR65_05095 [Culturomica sp.]|jgi:hypothetical protein|nr:hypothetical protein [Culturomica sp.]